MRATACEASRRGRGFMERSVSEVLQQGGCNCAPAEAHGGLCGSLCMGGLVAGQRWLAECMGGIAEQLDGPLDVWCRGAWAELQAGDLSFALMLPDDDRPLHERVEALAVWCHGFLAGLGFGGLPFGSRSLSDQLREILADFSEISRAHDAAASPDAEFDLAELIEYVRVSVQLVFEELAAVRGKSSNLVH